MKLYDVSRAHFYGEAQGDVYVELPPEMAKEGKCAKLMKSMYGTQDAAHIWQADYNNVLENGGFKAGKGSTAVFYHSEEDMQLLVHGDDFLALGDEAAHQNLEKMLKQKYDLRIEGCIGPESQDGTEMTVLGCVVRYNKEDGSVEYEADPRHAELMIREMGLEDAKIVTTPSTGSRDPKNDVAIQERHHARLVSCTRQRRQCRNGQLSNKKNADTLRRRRESFEALMQVFDRTTTCCHQI